MSTLIHSSPVRGIRIGAIVLWLLAGPSLADDTAASAEPGMDADAMALDLALWSAAAGGDINLFGRLILQGARVQESEAPTTPLWIAAQEGHTAIVQQLLALGADVEARDPVDGRTALFQAAQEGHTAIVRLLLESGARIDLTSARTGATPLFVAAARGHTDVVRLLIDGHADIDVRANADGIVDSPLSIAVKRGFADIAELIERAGDTTRVAVPVADQGG